MALALATLLGLVGIGWVTWGPRATVDDARMPTVRVTREGAGGAPEAWATTWGGLVWHGLFVWSFHAAALGGLVGASVFFGLARERAADSPFIAGMLGFLVWAFVMFAAWVAAIHRISPPSLVRRRVRLEPEAICIDDAWGLGLRRRRTVEVPWTGVLGVILHTVRIYVEGFTLREYAVSIDTHDDRHIIVGGGHDPVAVRRLGQAVAERASVPLYERA